MDDPYDILDVERGDDPETIKRSYRRLAFRYHPDRNEGDPKAAEHFRKVCEAYEAIDPEGRHSEGPGAGLSWSDLGLETLAQAVEAFHREWRSGRPPPAERPVDGRDRTVTCVVTFEETVTGTRDQIHFQGHGPCPTCDGAGATADAEWRECSRCGGTGETRDGLFGLGSPTPCARCRGRGRRPGEWCAACDGDGLTSRQMARDIEIPAGIRDGETLVISGSGEPGVRGGSSGDLTVRIRVEETDVFERHGRDVITEVDIPFSVAVLGGEVDFETPTGSVVMKIPEGTTDGQRFRLEGRGFPPREGRGRPGHLIAVARVAPDEQGRDGTVQRRSDRSLGGRVRSTIRRVVGGAARRE